MESSVKVKFEKNLPVQDLLILNEMVAEFDQVIENKYKGEIKLFLTDIVSGETILDVRNKDKNCLILNKCITSA